MTLYEVCIACARHIKSEERSCPFCGAVHERNPPALPRLNGRVSRAHWLAFGSTLAMMSCTDPSPLSQPGVDASSTAPDTMEERPAHEAQTADTGGSLDDVRMRTPWTQAPTRWSTSPMPAHARHRRAHSSACRKGPECPMAATRATARPNTADCWDGSLVSHRTPRWKDVAASVTTISTRNINRCRFRLNACRARRANAFSRTLIGYSTGASAGPWTMPEPSPSVAADATDRLRRDSNGSSVRSADATCRVARHLARGFPLDHGTRDACVRLARLGNKSPNPHAFTRSALETSTRWRCTSCWSLSSHSRSMGPRSA
jgi:hypothetical protein